MICVICGKDKIEFSSTGMRKRICKALTVPDREELRTLTMIANLPEVMSTEQYRWLNVCFSQ